MCKRVVCVLMLSLMLTGFGGAMLVSAQEGTPSPTAADGPIPVIIDSDMISDDWMATLFVLNDPRFDVQAITVTGTGFATCDAGVTAALGMLALTKYDEVPVSCWSEDPLAGENGPPEDWMTTLESVQALGLPDDGRKPADEDAVALFTTTVQNSPEPITVLALGPLTNIGAALEATPALVDNIEMIYVMGGAVDVEGSFVSDANTSAEWNIFSDPHGAALTFQSGAPITLVPLDATNEVPVTPAFVERLEAEKTSPAAGFVAALLSNNMESIESGSYYFWDPLAAVVMADPSIVTLTPRTVTIVDVPGDPEDGRTKPDDNGVEILVATAPDAQALEDALIAMWNAA
ncbi:MAG: nucleoside hydrolase [Thermomicrobiales bacterium]